VSGFPADTTGVSHTFVGGSGIGTPGTNSAVRSSSEAEDVKTCRAEGFAIIDVIFVCGIIGLLSSIAVPKLVLAKQAAGAASAIGSMRTIASSQLTFALTCGNGFYAPNLSTLGRPAAGSTDPFIGGGLGVANTMQRSGYQYRLDGAPYPGAPASCNGVAPGGAAQGYRAAADPTDPTNTRFFAVNSNAAVYEHSSTLFDDIPEVGESPIGFELR
jgi:type II secretory pathway pseudopilin PulG